MHNYRHFIDSIILADCFVGVNQAVDKVWSVFGLPQDIQQMSSWGHKGAKGAITILMRQKRAKCASKF